MSEAEGLPEVSKTLVCDPCRAAKPFILSCIHTWSTAAQKPVTKTWAERELTRPETED